MTLPEPLSLDLVRPAVPADQALVRAGHMLMPQLEAGRALDAQRLREAMEAAFGASDTNGAWVWKDAYEASECAAVIFLRKYGALMRRQAASPGAFLAMIGRVASLSPSHTRRSETSEKLQQFSTPLPLAMLVAHAAEIRDSDIVLEPSAGTGHLAVFAAIAGASIALNEYAGTRADVLARLFETASVTRHDAASIHDRLDPEIRPSVVLMNPPFSASPKVSGRYRAATMQHVRSALARLQPGGRLVLVSGSSFSAGNRDWRGFFDDMRERAHVVFTSAITGKVYARYGTTIETRLTVIDKVPGDHAGGQETTAETASDLLARLANHCPARPHMPAPAGRPVGTATPSVTALRERARAAVRAVAAERERHPLDAIEVVELAYRPAEQKPRAISSSTLYEPYAVETIDIKGARPHPTTLVQSAAMASVATPLPSYRPSLPAGLVDGGTLSDAQLESVILAGEAHAGHLKGSYTVDETYDHVMAAADDAETAVRFRRGWFLGDGTGCGKGRQVAGIIMDNWLKGRRRAVWLSKSDKLIEDAKRDWTALGGAASDIVSLGRFRQGREIRLGQGILFVTYATLRTAARQGKASRLAQIVEWLGAGFDGVIAFDEAHAMANAAGEKGDRGDKKPSQQGLAGLRLQNALPEARILYVSATGATVVSNLAYASRLGLWGTGDFPFASRAEFIASMEAGGIAAMEVISRDLKALGLYLARSISFEGVEYEMLVHELTDGQREIYDAYASAFQVIHRNLEAALQASGITSEEGTLNAQAKSAARSAFESNKQRFFNHLITAMKCPSLIRSIEADIAAGHSAVVQVVSTSEALLERRLADIPPSEWNDLTVDFSPREYVCDYLVHSFPVQLFEPYTDDEGNLQSRPAVDVDGNPVICREAVERREAMLELLCALAPVQGALDQILWHFGKDQVAEVTGRSRRIIRTGDGRLQVERRPASSNIGETAAFMDDDKRILVFSDAGGTGRSYHADLGAKNRRLRVHYLLEPGWRADNAIQGLGRTHRTNQAQPPLFRPCATDVKGEKRFLSTIARRLDTLGAITKGQRQTGGQNMFRAEDNLESTYARAALRKFFANIHAGQVDVCSLAKFEELTGLSLTDSDGTLREELPPIARFLNRCLALTIDMQNAIFERFTAIVDSLVEEAIAAGTHDIGLERLTAECFEIADRRTIYEHGEGGAATVALTINRTTRNTPMTIGDVCARAASDRHAVLLLNGQSGRAALAVPTTSLMTDDGVPIRRVELLRPMGREKLMEAELSGTQWKPADDTAFATAWQAEVNEIPEVSTDRITLVSGLLLPIWDRLPAENMRVYCLETDDGERVIGRLVTQDQLGRVYRAMGLDCRVEMTAKKVRDAVLDRRNPIDLAGGLQLRAARVMDRLRMELVGYSPSRLAQLKALGCYSEIIAWKTRLFVPVSDLTVLERLLAASGIAATREAA